MGFETALKLNDLSEIVGRGLDMLVNGLQFSASALDCGIFTQELNFLLNTLLFGYEPGIAQLSCSRSARVKALNTKLAMLRIRERYNIMISTLFNIAFIVEYVTGELAN